MRKKSRSNPSAVEEMSSTSIDHLKDASNHGDIQATLQLARLFQKGDSVSKSLPESFKYYKIAADHSNSEAQYQLGVYYFNGWGIPKSYEKAFSFLKIAADQGYMDAEYLLGYFYMYGLGVETSIHHALQYFTLATNKSDEFKDSPLGKVLQEALLHNIEKDPNLFKYLQELAEKNNGFAQRVLGMCFWLGYGNKPTKEEAIKWWQTAAEQGDEISKGCVAYCILLDFLPSKDPIKDTHDYLQGIQEKDTWAAHLYALLEKKGAIQKLHANNGLLAPLINEKEKQDLQREFFQWLRKKFFITKIG